MILDNSLLAYEFDKNQYTPHPVYPSGERFDVQFEDKYTNPSELPAVIALEDDIVNDEGYGLKKGFYNICPDKYLDNLLLYQSGRLKAKIPVFEVQRFESINAKTEKPKRMSMERYQKLQEKEKRKYFKGMNPKEVDYKEAQIFYDRELGAYIVIYSANNLELKAMIKM